MWLTLDEEEEDEEEDEELGSPPKLMLMLGNNALRPSCHSFTLIFSIELQVPAMETPPSPVLGCPCSTVKSKKPLCELEAVAVTVWFRCDKLLRDVTPIQD